MATSITQSEQQSEQRKGIWLALACYGAWGLFPLFWYPLNHSAMPAEQILAQRIVWSSVFALALLLLFGQGKALVMAFRQPKLLATFALSSLLIAANWLIYLWAIIHHHVVEASLGYFINPLVNMLLGWVIFKERLNVWQMAAIALCGGGHCVAGDSCGANTVGFAVFGVYLWLVWRGTQARADAAAGRLNAGNADAAALCARLFGVVWRAKHAGI